MARRLKRLDDATQHLKDRTEFTSGVRKERYGNFESLHAELHAGSPRHHGMWSYLPNEYHNSVAHATYVVYSYETPMAWWLDSPEPGASIDTVENWLAGGQVGFWVMPSVKYSPTTNQHQSLIASAIDPGTVIGRTFHESPWGSDTNDDGLVGWWTEAREYLTEYRQMGHAYKHEYKNRGEHANGPSVERSMY